VTPHSAAAPWSAFANAGSDGARISLTEGHAPLTVEGAALKAIDYTTPVPSAQVKTAGSSPPERGRNHNRTESIRTRDHGENWLEAFGVKVTRHLDSVSITGGQPSRVWTS